MEQKEHRKWNFDIERKRILKFLYANRKFLDKLTHTKIINEFKYSKPTFNRIIYFLEGAELITDIKIGNTNICQITEKGIQYIKEKQ